MTLGDGEEEVLPGIHREKKGKGGKLSPLGGGSRSGINVGAVKRKKGKREDNHGIPRLKKIRYDRPSPTIGGGGERGGGRPPQRKEKKKALRFFLAICRQGREGKEKDSLRLSTPRVA